MTSCSHLVRTVLKGSSRFVSEFLGQPISLQNLHPNSLVFMHKLFQLGLYILLFGLQSSLSFLELFKSPHQFILLGQHFFFFLKESSVFIFSVNFFFVKLRSMAFQNIVLGRNLMSFFIKLGKILVECLKLSVQVSFFRFQIVNMRLHIIDNGLNLTSRLFCLNKGSFSFSYILGQLWGLSLLVSGFILNTLDIGINPLNNGLLVSGLMREILSELSGSLLLILTVSNMRS